jgi:hypothetical protein
VVVINHHDSAIIFYKYTYYFDNFFGTLTIFVEACKTVPKSIFLRMEHLALYQALLNLSFLKIPSVILEETKILVHCFLDSPSEKYPTCKSDCSVINQYYKRTLQDLNITHRQVYLWIKIWQFHKTSCESKEHSK